MTIDGNLFIVHHYESSSFTRFVPASIQLCITVMELPMLTCNALLRMFPFKTIRRWLHFL